MALKRGNKTHWHARPLSSDPTFIGIITILACLVIAQLVAVSYHEDKVANTGQTTAQDMSRMQAVLYEKPQRAVAATAADISNEESPHLIPHFAPLPPFSPIENGKDLKTATLNGKPTVAGIAHLLQEFLLALHETQEKLAAKAADREAIFTAYLGLVKEHLFPLEVKYRGQSIFPIRKDGSIFVSIAAFRDHLLGQTLKCMFREAANPNKIYVGVVVQNCFGLDYTCKTGAQVVGKNSNGRDVTKVSDAPPDANGVAEFCQDDEFKKYCAAGHIRALYVNESEALGPAAARYWASKLWGGEENFVQVDAHVQFAEHWDTKYIEEAKATKAYPKAVLSSYPPGFNSVLPGSQRVRESPGARLCSCVFQGSDPQIIRINTGVGYTSDDVKAPTQIPFIAAGFFFARSEFLIDVPFDPILPWTFMGEEIALSMRAWTSGWDIYAPRKNLIAHQYRPGRMGLPKFWGSVGRTFSESGGRSVYNKLQIEVIQRVKHFVGYPEATRKLIEENYNVLVLADVEHYGLGHNRTREAYIELAGLDLKDKICRPLHWCNHGELL